MTDTAGDAATALVAEPGIQRRARLASVVTALRPRQWIKNLFVAGAVLFSGEFTRLDALAKVAIAIVLFCATASAVYLINDVVDRERDRLHPIKRHRPVASGELPARTAIQWAAGLLVAALLGAAALDRGLLGLLAAYAVMTSLYTLVLKHVVIVDVVTIAAGFIIRVLAGAVVIDVTPSRWLLICMGLLALLLGFGKRRQERLLFDGGGGGARAVLDAYTPRLLGVLVAASAVATVVAYAMYAATGVPSDRNLLVTVPFVMAGVARYLWLVFRRGDGENPTDMVWTDRPLVAIVTAWALTAALVVAIGG